MSREKEKKKEGRVRRPRNTYPVKGIQGSAFKIQTKNYNCDKDWCTEGKRRK